MHPSLAPHLHGEECREVIAKLHKCHAEEPYRKFLGACNDLKIALDRCLKKEYHVRQKANYKSATLRKQRYQEAMKKAWDEDYN